ncbi:MAG: hypothetical protein KAS32_05800 [Candidatus Peribacteraceae bacterium]|nr:hypothetical protein [Candidatus Peribacteraceae bacterium]
MKHLLIIFMLFFVSGCIHEIPKEVKDNVTGRVTSVSVYNDYKGIDIGYIVYFADYPVYPISNYNSVSATILNAISMNKAISMDFTRHGYTYDGQFYSQYIEVNYVTTID